MWNDLMYHKEEAQSIKYQTSYIEENIMNAKPHQSPNCFCMNWFSEFHFWNHEVYELVENRENSWKLKKIMKMHVKREMTTTLLKFGF